MRYDFRWNAWNLGHIAEHGVASHEAEYIVDHPSAGYPERIEDGKFRVRGQTPVGRYLQAIYIFDPQDVIYVIHARDLTDPEKRQWRRRRRKRQ